MANHQKLCDTERREEKQLMNSIFPGTYFHTTRGKVIIHVTRTQKEGAYEQYGSDD